jgi:serine/threonine-protein kinase
MNCSSCKSEIPEGSLICPSCGTEVTQPTIPLAEPRRQEVPSGEHGRFLPGTILARRYRIVSLLGKGGMGEVYRADDLKLGQAVALKLLPERLAGDSKRLEYLHNEVRLARQVSHPNVCRVHDIGEVDGQHFLSMEYIDGEDLATLIRRIGRLPPDKGVDIARQLCAGLAAAHDRGVLHRDLKPANIMLDGRGRARITDFGLARMTGEKGGVAAGTPVYMAPEQFAGLEVSERSDIYSLGLVLFEVFTGTPAFEAETASELARMKEKSSPRAPSDIVADIDPAVERVILQCLQKEPPERPESALAVLAALPGGDPLAAALAAGETPSPEMVGNVFSSLPVWTSGSLWNGRAKIPLDHSQSYPTAVLSGKELERTKSVWKLRPITIDLFTLGLLSNTPYRRGCGWASRRATDNRSGSRRAGLWNGLPS